MSNRNMLLYISNRHKVRHIYLLPSTITWQFSHLFTYSLTHIPARTHSFTYKCLAHSLTHTFFRYVLARSLTRSFVCSLARSHTHSLIHPLAWLVLPSVRPLRFAHSSSTKPSTNTAAPSVLCLGHLNHYIWTHRSHSLLWGIDVHIFIVQI